MTPLRVFIGYDSREPVAYHVLCHSIVRRATYPLSITPIALDHLLPFWKRERGPTESTEFSISRFLVPWLCGYEGKAVFMDCDMLCSTNILDLFLVTDWRRAVFCCQHEYVPKTSTKFLGQTQTVYPRKNWSSLMVFDCEAEECRRLTPEYVRDASGLELHRFLWADDKVGSIPLEWNWLVGEYATNPNAKMLHYTLGGPWFPEYRNCDHAEDWRRELAMMTGPQS